MVSAARAAAEQAAIEAGDKQQPDLPPELYNIALRAVHKLEMWCASIPEHYLANGELAKFLVLSIAHEYIGPVDNNVMPSGKALNDLHAALGPMAHAVKLLGLFRDASHLPPPVNAPPFPLSDSVEQPFKRLADAVKSFVHKLELENPGVDGNVRSRAGTRISRWELERMLQHGDVPDAVTALSQFVIDWLNKKGMYMQCLQRCM
jgi:hypothetical protein